MNLNRKTTLLVAAAAAVLLGIGLWLWLRQPAANSSPIPQLTATFHDNGFGEQIPIEQTEDKTPLEKLYALPHIKEYYDYQAEAAASGQDKSIQKPTPLPKFDFGQDISHKSYVELLLLRNAIYARNGWCFMNATVRHYFDGLSWYRPLWDIKGFRVPLNRQEIAFTEKIHARELELLKNRLVKPSGYSLINPAFAVNQRELLITPAMQASLGKRNFVIVPTPEEQLFYLYDQNQYDYTPTYVTTDFFLQLLHKYFNGILTDVEETKLVPIVGTMLRAGNAQSLTLAQQCQNPQARQAAEWAAAYYWIGQQLLEGGAGATLPETYRQSAEATLAQCTEAAGTGSDFLRAPLLDFSNFRPRGLYTRTDTTRRYFRAVKWLNSAPIYLDDDAGLLAALTIAKVLEQSPEAGKGFITLTQLLNVLAGPEDNRSLTNLLALLKDKYAGKSLDELAAPEELARIRQQLLATGRDRIRQKGGSPEAQAAADRPALLFTAGRYSFDGEILSRLTHILRPNPRRVFPKGLDVFAAFGDSTAQDVLLNHYREAARWPAYPDTLRALQRQFKNELEAAGNDENYESNFWNQSLYTKTMQVLMSLRQPIGGQDGTLLYARTPDWKRRNLSTALGGWAELKHDLLLYSEQPSGAEGGEGGGPPPPQHLGCVEPNVEFWRLAQALLDYQDKTLNKLSVNTEHLSGLNRELAKMAHDLGQIAEQEVNNQPISNEQMDRLSFIGALAEGLLLQMLKTTQLPERERHMANIADVYSYNGRTLEEGVGAADALYVLVEINGVPVVARGAIFSYYEFESNTRLTDEEWKAQLNRKPPPRPTWLQDLIVPVPALYKKQYE